MRIKTAIPLCLLALFACLPAYAAVAIAGTGLIQAIVYFVIVSLLFWLVWWFWHYVAPPQPFLKIGEVLIGLAAFVFLANFLLGLIGHPIFA